MSAARSPSPGRGPGNSNDGAHVEQKNWAVVRIVVGYHRYDTMAELLLLSRIWVLQSRPSSYFCPQQKLISKVRDGAKVVKKYDRATTPHRREICTTRSPPRTRRSSPTPTRASTPPLSSEGSRR